MSAFSLLPHEDIVLIEEAANLVVERQDSLDKAIRIEEVLTGAAIRKCPQVKVLSFMVGDAPQEVVGHCVIADNHNMTIKWFDTVRNVWRKSLVDRGSIVRGYRSRLCKIDAADLIALYNKVADDNPDKGLTPIAGSYPACSLR